MKLLTKTEFMRQHHIGFKQLQEMIDKNQVEMVGNRIKVIDSYEGKVVLDIHEYEKLKEIEAKYKIMQEMFA